MNGFSVFKGACWLELQLRVRLSLAKLPERIRNHTVPGDAFHETDAQGSRLAGGHTLGTRRRFIHLVKDSSCILQQTFARRADFHSTREAVKEFETNLLFQILNL